MITQGQLYRMFFKTLNAPLTTLKTFHLVRDNVSMTNTKIYRHKISISIYVYMILIPAKHNKTLTSHYWDCEEEAMPIQ